MSCKTKIGNNGIRTFVRLVLPILKTIATLAPFLATLIPTVSCLRDVKENAVVLIPNVGIVCIDARSWTASLTKTQNIFRCDEGPLVVTTEANTTIGPRDLPVASLIFQWAYSYFHENSSDPMFQKMSTTPKTDRLGIASSLASQNLDGIYEDKFLHHSMVDKVFNNMLGKGYRVTNQFNQMAFEFPFANGTIVMAKGKQILTKMIHF